MPWEHEILNKGKDPNCKCTNKKCGRRFHVSEIKTFRRKQKGENLEAFCPICRKGDICLLKKE